MTTFRVEPKHRSPGLITILDKMIFTDLFKTLFSVLSIMVIIIVSRKFIRVLMQAIEGTISHETVLSILGMKTIAVTALLVPASVFMAVLMVIGRMYRDQEVPAISAARGGASVLYRAVFLLVVPISVAAGWLSLSAAPWAEEQMQILTNRDIETMEVKGITAGRFKEFSDGEKVFYVEDIDQNGRLRKVFVQNRRQERVGVINSEFGRIEQRAEGMYLILEQGTRVQGNPGQEDFVIENFDEYGVRIDKKSQVLTLDLESRPSLELWHGATIPEKIELQNRLSIPLGVLVLSLLAVPLAKISPRGGMYGNLAIAFVIYFIYGNILKINQSLVVDGHLPVWGGFVGVYLVMAAVGGLLLVKLYGWYWVRLVILGRAPV